MKLRPKNEAPPWAPTNKGHGITSWPIRHHHAIIVELRPTHTKIMSHQPSMKSTCIPTSFQYSINHPTTFHRYIMPNSSNPTHTIRSYMHIQILHTLNRVIQTKLTINNQKHGQGTTMEQILAPVSLKPGTIAQAKEVFHSSHRSSLRRDFQQRAPAKFASSCWGEPSSPERDYPSSKGEVPCLGYKCSDVPQAPTSSRVGEPLPKRDSTSLKTRARVWT